MLPDTNVWLALTLSGHSHHTAAATWLNSQSDDVVIRFCRATQQSLMRLLTTKALMEPYGLEPMTNRAAWSVYDEFVGDQRIGQIEEPSGLEAIWRRFANQDSNSPKLWMDAYLAAFAMGRQATLVTTDRGFLQFTGLDVVLVEARPQ